MTMNRQANKHTPCHCLIGIDPGSLPVTDVNVLSYRYRKTQKTGNDPGRIVRSPFSVPVHISYSISNYVYTVKVIGYISWAHIPVHYPTTLMDPIRFPGSPIVPAVVR